MEIRNVGTVEDEFKGWEKGDVDFGPAAGRDETGGEKGDEPCKDGCRRPDKLRRDREDDSGDVCDGYPELEWEGRGGHDVETVGGAQKHERAGQSVGKGEPVLPEAVQGLARVAGEVEAADGGGERMEEAVECGMRGERGGEAGGDGARECADGGHGVCGWDVSVAVCMLAAVVCSVWCVRVASARISKQEP